MGLRSRKRRGTDDVAGQSFKSFDDSMQLLMKRLSKGFPELLRKPIAAGGAGGTGGGVPELFKVEKNDTSNTGNYLKSQEALSLDEFTEEIKRMKDALSDIDFNMDGKKIPYGLNINRPLDVSEILGQYKKELDISRPAHDYPGLYPFRDPYRLSTTPPSPRIYQTPEEWFPYQHFTPPTPPRIVHQKPGLHAWHIILVAVVAIVSLFAYACTVSSLRRQTRKRRSQQASDASAAPLAGRARPPPSAPPRSEIYSETSSTVAGRSGAPPPLLPPRMQPGTALPDIGFILVTDPPSTLQRAPTPPPPYPGLPANANKQPGGGVRDVEAPPPSYNDVTITNEAATHKDPT